MKPILPALSGPEQLRGLDHDELLQLCSELREEIISTVSDTGGHLGASLGVIELTVALHSSYESPRDKIIWDVGHQAYVHKLLTGRLDRFPTLRQKGGLAGFPKRSESEHDMFGVGHASTAVSAALGYAAARDARGEDHKVVAIVGDGALTGGLAFEGLNNAGQASTDMLVVLNDNKMSISPNVGGLARYLTLITSDEFYTRFEREVWKLLGVMPRGQQAQKLAGRVKEGLKNLVVPTILFEELGFSYFGPIDGHDLGLLRRTFAHVSKLRGPVFVHVVTEKGKGYSFAEQDDQRYHGVGAFDKAEGVKTKTAKVPSWTRVFSDALLELAADDERIHAVTAAMPSGTGVGTFQEVHPDRSWDVGIAEQHAVTFAAGLACRGLRPVCAIYSTFLQRAVDQVIHDVALQKLPVVFAIDRAGVVGEDGPTHHGVFDLTFMRMVPGMVVMAPSDENELRRMLATALGHDDGPVALRYPRGSALGIEVDATIEPIPLGRSRTLRDGEDLAILAVGSMVVPSLAAAERLEKAGLTIEVIDMRFVKPLDEDRLADVWSRHRLVLTVEENALAGGFGSAVLEWCERHDAAEAPRVVCHGIGDTFQDQASRAELLADLKLDADGIAEVAEAALVQMGASGAERSAS
ncbi:1-deoxy-D-xylulose-5-phosphate synthase [bacterium]|nr:1-deoxy-D-xylulose-5-phosphate synthase [bacterium]